MHPDIGKQTENVLAQAAEREGWIKCRYPTDKERMHFRWVCAQPLSPHPAQAGGNIGSRAVLLKHFRCESPTRA
jgi:hypothetical protein